MILGLNFELDDTNIIKFSILLVSPENCEQNLSFPYGIDETTTVHYLNSISSCVGKADKKKNSNLGVDRFPSILSQISLFPAFASFHNYFIDKTLPTSTKKPM